MHLSSLLPVLGPHVRHGSGDPLIGSVTDRDDAVRPGDLYVAIRGARVDGHDRLPMLTRAAAWVVERPVAIPQSGRPVVIEVADTRIALAALSAARLGHPAKAMKMVGVTGTNGKTSTTYLIEAMARAAGWKVGVIGTTGHHIDGRSIPSTFTTPTAPALQALLAEMRDDGCGMVAMEVSSIGLAAHRVDAIPFGAAVFTNLTRDHLDYHGSMAFYAAAKRRLFAELLEGTAVLNAADPAHLEMWPTGRPVWTFDTDNANNNANSTADLRAEDVSMSAGGTRARFCTPLGSFEAHMNLVGRHNVENALGALGGALAVAVPLDACAEGLSALPAVPGRLEAVPTGRGFTVLVDYAHSDDALRRVLAELRRLGPRRIITVFGCGGDRDRGKRPLMGAAAAAGSEVVFVTSDNPRSEDPAAIIADILPGIGARSCVVEPDRRRAIFAAISEAGPGDVVLIAGKGHETTQEIAGVKEPFDDREVAREALR